MTQEEIDGNRIIAEFMGELDLYHWGRDPFNEFRKAEYHTSLDWLKPAIDKIESTFDEFHGYFLVHIVSNSCTIQGTKLNTGLENPHYAYFAEHHGKDKIEAVFLAVVSFIKWYNQAIEQVKQTTPDRV